MMSIVVVVFVASQRIISVRGEERGCGRRAAVRGCPSQRGLDDDDDEAGGRAERAERQAGKAQ